MKYFYTVIDNDGLSFGPLREKPCYRLRIIVMWQVAVVTNREIGRRRLISALTMTWRWGVSDTLTTSVHPTDTYSQQHDSTGTAEHYEE